MEINENEVYTPEETTKILKISSSTTMRLIKQGIIQAAKVGKQYRILGKDILRMLSPQLEDQVGKIYGKGRRWLHVEEDHVKDQKAKLGKSKKKNIGEDNVNRLEK